MCPVWVSCLAIADGSGVSEVDDLNSKLESGQAHALLVTQDLQSSP